MARFRDPRGRSEWLRLGDASRLLGVAPGTLRRWSDAGRVSSFTTPGGHRRYRRVALEQMLPADRAKRPALVRSGMTAGRLARAYRQEARGAARTMPWLNGLTDEQRAWFRTHGRLLAEALLVHIDAEGTDSTGDSLRDATAEAAAYGRMAAGLGVSLSQTIEGFLQFRRPFLHQLGLFAGRGGLDVRATTGLMETTERAMDRLLIAAMNSYTIERVGERHGSDVVESEGLR